MDLVSSVPTGDGTPDPAILERLNRMQRIMDGDAQLQVHDFAETEGMAWSMIGIEDTLKRLGHLISRAASPLSFTDQF